MAQTTTTEGKTVDFIVRVEKGTINRAIYQIAFLHQPGNVLPDPWTRAPDWNGRLVYLFGGDCKAGYRQGTLMAAALSESILAHGYAMAASTLNVFGNNCDDVISAETMTMAKSTSPPLTQVVELATSKTSVNPSTAGETVKFTAVEGLLRTARLGIHPVPRLRPKRSQAGSASIEFSPERSAEKKNRCHSGLESGSAGAIAETVAHNFRRVPVPGS
jgi:hypothetical protein